MNTDQLVEYIQRGRRCPQFVEYVPPTELKGYELQLIEKERKRNIISHAITAFIGVVLGSFLNYIFSR